MSEDFRKKLSSASKELGIEPTPEGQEPIIGIGNRISFFISAPTGAGRYQEHGIITSKRTDENGTFITLDDRKQIEFRVESMEELKKIQ